MAEKNTEDLILRLGDNGPRVEYLQRKLHEFYPGSWPNNGVFGYATEAMVKNLQAERGLPITGVVDLRTWAAIENPDSLSPEPRVWLKHNWPIVAVVTGLILLRKVF